MASKLSYERARERLSYDADSGELFWLPRPGKGGLRTRKRAGSIKKDGYRWVTVDRAEYAAHRVCWLLHIGRWPDLYIDHINGEKSDNRIANLREVTASENLQNLHRANANNKAGYLGVCRHEGKFAATIKLHGKQRWLGRFDTALEAHKAYLAAKAALHPMAPGVEL